jgi:CheY-like chemotaxis protein
MTSTAKRILVVDDEPDMRTFLSTVLEDNGYRYECAKDGDEAMEMLQADPPDLVCLDVTMPNKSGVGVYRNMKESDQFKGIPVIFVTGVTEDFEKFISSRRQVPPPEGYIAKPVDDTQFLEMIRKLLNE